MARLSSIKHRWRVAIVGSVMLYLFTASLPASGALQQSDADSTDAKSVAEPSDQKSTPVPLKAESIDDLFRNFSNDLGRLRAGYDLIGDADEAQLVELFDQVTNREYAEEEGPSKFELISLISTRLAGMNLDKTVALYESQPSEVAKHMLYSVMYVWASKDYDDAVRFARKQDASVHSVALRGIVDASLGLPDSTLLKLGTELGEVAYVERVLAARQLEMDLADPDQAWARLIKDPSINLKENFFRVKLVANALIDKHGVSEIDDLLSSISSPTLSFGLRKSILSNVALSDPESAFNIALETPNDVFGTMLTAVINTWATTDPQSALARVRALEPSIVRDRLQHKVVSSWVQLSPDQFVDTFDDIPIELHDTARLSLVGQLSKDSIDRAFVVMLDIQDVNIQEEAVLTMLDDWIDSNPDEAFEWILFSGVHEKYRDQLVNSFLVKLSDKDADRAFDLAMSQSVVEETGIGLEAIVVDSLKFSDTDLALDLLRRVRPGKTQLAALESVSEGLISDLRTDEALALGKQLSEKDQESFYNNIASAIVWRESPKRIVELISSLPVKEARSRMADTALSLHTTSDDEGPYSDEDIETLLKHLTPAKLQLRRLLLNR